MLLTLSLQGPVFVRDLEDMGDTVFMDATGAWVSTTPSPAEQAALRVGNLPTRKALLGESFPKVCVREEGETKVGAKFQFSSRTCWVKGTVLMVEESWGAGELSEWASAVCGVPADAFYWVFESRVWGSNNESVKMVGRDGRLVMCGRLRGGTSGWPRFSAPVEGKWTVRDVTVLARASVLVVEVGRQRTRREGPSSDAGTGPCSSRT